MPTCGARRGSPEAWPDPDRNDRRPDTAWAAAGAGHENAPENSNADSTIGTRQKSAGIWEAVHPVCLPSWQVQAGTDWMVADLTSWSTVSPAIQPLISAMGIPGPG